MAVVAGVVFFTIRAPLALFPALTVGYPIKKWAAAAAFAAAAFYLLLSGNDVATQRSFFMTAVVLIAVMVDRVLQRTPLGRGHEFKLLAAGRAVRPPDLQGCCRFVEAGIGHHVNAVVELALVSILPSRHSNPLRR
jgi:hypothetical protein